jgi:MoaA/NifB/PqqE/SkfB family radical SAM enzyme
LKISDFLLNLKYAFNLKKPLLVARLARAFIRSNFLGKTGLRYVDFAIDFKCNLKCEHCFATSLEDNKRKKMSVADYGRVAEEAMALGAVNFSFQGGEPLLCGELGDIIAACKPHKNVISVTTNGTLLSAEKIRQLKSWGVDILTISLDSGEPAEHDKFRGASGTFERTLKAIKLALSSGLRVTVGTVVTHQSLRSDGIKKLIELSRELKVLLYFILPVPAGRWIDEMKNSGIFLTPEDLDHINSLTGSNPYLRTDFQANLGGYGCGAAKEILYLTPYGDVLTCPFLHIRFGNVMSESLGEIRARALKNKFFAGYHQKCLASTDADFIESYLSRTFHSPQLPMDHNEVFGPK